MIVLLNSARLYTWNYSFILSVFNFTKKLEVDVAKTRASGKSHGMRADCDSLYESWTFLMLGTMHESNFSKELQTYTNLFHTVFP